MMNVLCLITTPMPSLLKTSTGIWHVTYNAENRPILFSNDTTVIEMAYDYMGRRFEYKETVSGALTRHERYLYRGYLQIAALDMRNSANVKHTIVWDPTERLAARPLALQIETSACYYSFDQVKNVTELFDSTGALAVTYDYAPFGAVTSLQITQSSNQAITQFSNPLTFSSEVSDSILGLQYYNYRHLNTMDGRWVNRDPMEESGGVNVYGMVCNRLLDAVDALGLWRIEHTSEQAVAIAKPEMKREDLYYLSHQTGLSYREILGWARKSITGEKFNSIEEAQSACVIYLPNRVIEVLPDEERRSNWEDNIIIAPWLEVRRVMSIALRNSLSMVGNKYVAAGFQVRKFDFEEGNYEDVLNPAKPMIELMMGWPTMGLLIGGHGAAPIPGFLFDGGKRPDKVGSIQVSEGFFLTPGSFTGDRDYKLQTLLVFGCYVGHDSDWRELGVSPGSSSIAVSGPGPHFLLSFPYSLTPPTW